MADPQTLLGMGLVLTTLLVAAIGDRAAAGSAHGETLWRVIAISVEFLAAQAIAAVVAPHLRPTSAQRAMIGIARFALAILYVSVVTGLLRTDDFRPTGVLFIPVVALAAAQGTRQAVLVGTAAVALYLLPVLSASAANVTLDAQRAIALCGTAVLLSIGTRRSISNLTITVRRLGSSLARDRRRSRQVAAVEGVGRLLAATGPTPEVLARVVGLLRDDLGYDFVSFYLGSASRMRLVAQRGYDEVIEEFDGTVGVIGRVMRTRTVAFVPDVTADPDYLTAAGIVRSEISAPLVVGDELYGVVNVEARDSASLDHSDVETMSLVADRVASALALARERERLAERADRFRQLTTFATAVNATLDPGRVHQTIVDELHDLLAADIVGLTVLDRASGTYVVRAVAGVDRSMVGLVMEPGQGMAGRAIADRAVVVVERYDPTSHAAAIEAGLTPRPMTSVALPLIRNDIVVGAVTLARDDVERVFAAEELDALPIIAGLVALALTNTFLHADMTELSVRDALTGLFNRRYLDATIARAAAARSRRSEADRDRVAIVIFDLDHFGAVNKQYGHRAGDDILRAFADLLQSRLRGADVVARYGGEEFLAVLDGASAEQAAVVADEIRLAFAGLVMRAPDGSAISATVSAGCAGLGSHEDEFDQAIARADVGLVLAKRSGRNRVVTA